MRKRSRNDELSEIHKQRLDRLVKQNLSLEEENAALRAMHGDADELLVRLAGALRVAADHAAPAPSSVPMDSDQTRGKPGPREPSGGNRLARVADRGLRSAVWRAIDTFDRRVENDWRRPSRWEPTEAGDVWPSSVPKVRCGNRECVKRGTRVAAYRVVAGELEVRWRCPECERLYGSHPMVADPATS